MKLIKYPKTQQYREVLASINRMITYVGLDDNGKAIYDHSIKKPKLIFNFTCKLHGENAAVSYNTNDGLYTQSKKKRFSLDQLESHRGFTFMVKQNEEIFQGFMDDICAEHNIDPNVFTITIYMESCGKGIQDKAAITEIEKASFIFAIKISKPNDPEFNSYWLDKKHVSKYNSNENRIFNIYDYPTYEVEVDFNYPQLAQNRFVELVNMIENECPVAKTFGISGIGEGLVGTCIYEGSTHRIKIKGPKHSVSNIKKVASIDVEKINSIMEFIDYSVTENRFKQALNETFDDLENLDIKKMGDLLRWIVNDINSEEMDTMVENGLVPKDVNKYISTRAREMFFEIYNRFD